MSTDGPDTRLTESSSSGRALVPNLPRDAWVVLGGDMLSAVGSGLTLPFFLERVNATLAKATGYELRRASTKR